MKLLILTLALSLNLIACNSPKNSDYQQEGPNIKPNTNGILIYNKTPENFYKQFEHVEVDKNFCGSATSCQKVLRTRILVTDRTYHNTTIYVEIWILPESRYGLHYYIPRITPSPKNNATRDCDGCSYRLSMGGKSKISGDTLILEGFGTLTPTIIKGVETVILKSDNTARINDFQDIEADMEPVFSDKYKCLNSGPECFENYEFKLNRYL